MRLKVAVLEDDAELREGILIPQLRAADFHVEGFATSADLYQAMPDGMFDLLVLDIGLPDVDGLAVARRLRASLPIGIVVLTGRREVADQIKGLSEAVDVWLVKPVEIEVLAATLLSVARRMQMAASRNEAGPRRWRLSSESWRLHAPDDRGVLLSYSERRLLARLFETPGQLVTHDELVGALVNAVEDIDLHRLEMLIHRLRRKVVGELGRSLPLRSVRSRGYVLLDDERAAVP